MKQLFLFISLLIMSCSLQAQVPNFVKEFKEAPIESGKVVFSRSVSLKQSDDSSYQALRIWARNNYGKDPFISSLRYNNDGKSITARSRIELLLPTNSAGEREKVTMRYRLDISTIGNLCIIKYSNISYMYENPNKNALLPKLTKAENMITADAIASDETLKEIRSNTLKSTLYFINQTNHELYSALLAK